MPAQQVFTFEEHDKLNRKPFADFLFSLIQHRNEYRRPDSNKSYSIAIDAVYGSGKTRFLKMFQFMVQQDGSYNIAYYSAWEHDLYDDALAPILSLLDRPAGIFEDQAYTRMEQTLGTKALRILKRMGTSFLSMKAKKHFGKDYEEIVDDIKALFNEESADPDAYDLRMKCIEELQKGLQKATEDVPLIFIIDELDRCNPSFAIKTLEVVKHLLDVENIIFLFALDMHQMRAVTKKFYGQDIDASGYLFKIFDYMTILPPPDIERYIRSTFSPLDSVNTPSFHHFVTCASEVLQHGDCTLRFVDTIYTTFCIMWNTFLSLEHSESTFMLYFSILYLKFTHPELYIALTNATEGTVLSVRSELRKYLPRENILIDFCDLCAQTINVMRHSSPLDMQIEAYRNSNPSRYNEITYITYGQFIHRQLEMYNPIRTLEPTSNTPTT